LSEVRRVLRSRGALLLSTPAHGRALLLSFALRPARFDAHFDPRSDHLHFYTRRSLTLLLRDFRFESIDVREAGGAIPGARRLLLASARRSRFLARRYLLPLDEDRVALPLRPAGLLRVGRAVAPARRGFTGAL